MSKALEKMLADLKQARAQLQVFRDLGAFWPNRFIASYDELIADTTAQLDIIKAKMLAVRTTP